MVKKVASCISKIYNKKKITLVQTCFYQLVDLEVVFDEE
jgi:hypothetical protein